MIWPDVKSGGSSYGGLFGVEAMKASRLSKFGCGDKRLESEAATRFIARDDASARARTNSIVKCEVRFCRGGF
jgi:hypothetical protein